MDDVTSDEKRLAEAAKWLARLNSRAISTDELDKFYEWRRDPANAEAYSRAEQLWHNVRLIGDDREIAETVREALERPRLEAETPTPLLLRRRTLVLGSAALAAAAGAWFLTLGGTTYRTAVGEQLAVRLDDGSLMRLNTDSEVHVRYSGSERGIEVARGQAFFEVRREQRPFRVRVSSADVIALGTRFDVSFLTNTAQIMLAEGRVRVAAEGGEWERILGAPGEAIQLTGGVPRLRRVDIEATTSWTSGRLTFRGAPLAQAIAEVNRYSRTKIVLEAPELQGTEVDGVFEAGDLQAFVSALTTLFPLQAQVVGERIVLTRA